MIGSAMQNVVSSFSFVYYDIHDDDDDDEMVLSVILIYRKIQISECQGAFYLLASTCSMSGPSITC